MRKIICCAGLIHTIRCDHVNVTGVVGRCRTTKQHAITWAVVKSCSSPSLAILIDQIVHRSRHYFLLDRIRRSVSSRSRATSWRRLASRTPQTEFLNLLALASTYFSDRISAARTTHGSGRECLRTRTCTCARSFGSCILCPRQRACDDSDPQLIRFLLFGR